MHNQFIKFTSALNPQNDDLKSNDCVRCSACVSQCNIPGSIKQILSLAHVFLSILNSPQIFPRLRTDVVGFYAPNFVKLGSILVSPCPCVG